MLTTADQCKKRERGQLWRRLYPFIWLIYLAFYFLPWLARPPGRLELIASVLGIAAFLALYVDAYLLRWPPRGLWHVIGIAAIGYLLSPFNATCWIFSVYASVLAALLEDRRKAVATLALLQVALVAFALLRQLPVWNWMPGVFIGVVVGLGTFWQADVSRKNAELLKAQDEVRALAATAERERIARDLHDLLGHTLTLVAVKADLAQRLAARDPAAAAREMQEVAETARQALGEVRTAVAGIRGAPFAAEVERARRALAAASVQTSVAIAAAPEDPERESVLAMALREAVTNVIRHAGARSCAIALEADPDGALRLSVTDDGQGGPIEEGSGISGMRARLAAAGGALEVISGEGGARVLARLPAAAA